MANLNLDEILALFENGERRYAEDPIFKSVADSLKMGLGVYAVLDHTLKEVNRLNGVIKKLNYQVSEFEDTNCALISAGEAREDYIAMLEDEYKKVKGLEGL